MNHEQTIAELQAQIQGMQRLIDKLRDTLTKSLSTIADQHGEIYRLRRELGKKQD